MNDSGFIRGAGVSADTTSNVFALGLIVVLIIAVVWIVIGAAKAWSRGDIKFEDLQGYLIRALVFLVLVLVVMGLT